MEKTIIFGASELGKNVYNLLKDNEDICFFSDNDKKKQGTKFCGIDVIPPEELVRHKNLKIIIASMYYTQISTQLKEMMLDNIYVFFSNGVTNKPHNFKYWLEKVCDTSVYKNLYINENESRLFINDYKTIYKNERLIKNRPEINYGEKNVLMIAYAFSPIGSSGVQRTLKFVKYLKSFGWNPIVVTVGENFLPVANDYSMLKEISESVSIIRIDDTKNKTTESLMPDEAQEIINFIYGIVNDYKQMNSFLNEMNDNNCANRRYIMTPESQLSWVQSVWALDVLIEIGEIVDFNKIDIIYSTSSPYLDHCIGYYLKSKYNIPWISDFRDEWTYYHGNKYMTNKTKTQFSLEELMEINIVNKADKVITTTPIMTLNYRNLFGLHKDKVHTITNGYDDDDFIFSKDLKAKNKKFTIKHNGKLHSKRAEPFTFIKAVNELIDENKLDENKIHIEFIGEQVIDIINGINDMDIYNITLIKPYMPHKQSLENLNNSDLLLIILGVEDDFKKVYPGKIFEYMNVKKNILALAPKDSLVEEMLHKTRTGESVEMNDIEGIKKYVLKCYDDFINDDEYNDFDHDEIKKYNRKSLTGQLAKIFDEAAGYLK